jgi:hypothetical protein
VAKVYLLRIGSSQSGVQSARFQIQNHSSDSDVELLNIEP